MIRPAPILGFRRRHRATGEPYLHAIVGEDLHVPAGSTLDLRRLHDGALDSPKFALLIVAPTKPWQPSKTERSQVAADRLDGSAIRQDHRDAGTTEAAPW